MSTLPSCMVADLKLAELNTFGKLTLQSIGEFLEISGCKYMPSERLVQVIEGLAEDAGWGKIPSVKVISDLVLPDDSESDWNFPDSDASDFVLPY